VGVGLEIDRARIQHLGVGGTDVRLVEGEEDLLERVVGAVLLRRGRRRRGGRGHRRRGRGRGGGGGGGRGGRGGGRGRGGGGGGRGGSGRRRRGRRRGGGRRRHRRRGAGLRHLGPLRAAGEEEGEREDRNHCGERLQMSIHQVGLLGCRLGGAVSFFIPCSSPFRSFSAWSMLRRAFAWLGSISSTTRHSAIASFSFSSR